MINAIAESIIIAIMATTGITLLHKLKLRGWGLIPIGSILGVVAFILFGLFQLLLYLPTTPWLPIVIATTAIAIYWLGQYLAKKSWKYIVLTFLVPFGIACLSLAIYPVAIQLSGVRHVDTMEYLVIGSLLESNNLEHVTKAELPKRLIAVSMVHSPANLFDRIYIVSMMPMLAIAQLASLVWLLRKALDAEWMKNKSAAVTIITLGILVMVSTHWYIISIGYINSHLFFGVLLAMINLITWLTVKKSKIPLTATITLQSSLLAALILSRPEGFMFAILSIIPIVASRNITIVHKKIVIASVGFITLAWHTVLSMRLTDQILSTELSVLGPMVLGTSLIGLSLLLNVKLVKSAIVRHLPFVVEAGLWLVLIALGVREPEIFNESLHATLQNVTFGIGMWGWSWWTLFILAFTTIMVFNFPNKIVLRYSITTFIPVGFILAFLRELEYNVSPGDSLNRMWVQILPSVVVLVIIAFTAGSARINFQRQAKAIER